MPAIRPYTSSQLDAVCPVDWTHGMNKGLVLRLRATPGLTGGRTWPNLAGSAVSQKPGRLDGTLAGNISVPGTSTSGWQPARMRGEQSARRLGYYGGMAFDGFDDYINLGAESQTGPLNFNDQDFSIAFWWRDSTATSSGLILAKTSGAGTNGYDIACFAGLNGQVGFRINSGGAAVQIPYALNNGRWYHFIMRYRSAGGGAAGTGTIFVNGILVATGTIGTAAVAANSSAPFQVGGRAGASFVNACEMDDICVWNRRVEGAEALNWYLDACRSAPATLRWVSDNTYIDFHPTAREAVASRSYQSGDHYVIESGTRQWQSGGQYVVETVEEAAAETQAPLVPTRKGASINGQLDAVCPVDWLNPLNQNLELRLLTIPGWVGSNRWINLARPRGNESRGVLTNMAIPASDTSGWKSYRAHDRPGGQKMAVRFDGTDDYIDCGVNGVLPDNHPLKPTRAVTVCAWVKVLTAVATARVASTRPGSGNGGYLLAADSTVGDTPRFLIGNGAAYSVALSPTALTLGRWYHWCGTWDGVTARLYIDGVEVASQAASSINYTANAPLTCGADWTGGAPGAALNGMLDDVCVWSNRALSAGQVKQWYEDSLAGSPGTLRWLPTAAHSPAPADGGAGITITADAATFTITGTAANFTRTYKFPVDPGAYSLDGVAASLLRGLEVQSDVGDYQINGTAATTLHGWATDPDVGAYDITGTNANLLKGNEIAVDAGVYVITGTDATLSYGGAGLVLTADPGSYVITGTDATFDFTYVMAAFAGIYIIDGTAATLSIGKEIAADAGIYVITGTDATFSFELKMVTDVGSYSLNGTTASLEIGREITADVGSYTVNGIDATFRRGVRVVADVGTYSLNGTASGLLKGNEIATDPGSYLINGVDASFLISLVIEADPGEYSLTGTATALLRTTLLHVDPGSYTITGESVELEHGGAVVIMAAEPGSYTITGSSVEFTHNRIDYNRIVWRCGTRMSIIISGRSDSNNIVWRGDV
jgi:hypothetical protein